MPFIRCLRADHCRPGDDGRNALPARDALPVATVVAMVADAITADQIVDDLPDLTVDDVAEALRYAGEAGGGTCRWRLR